MTDPALQSELRAVLASAIHDLPTAYRTVFVLRDVEGLSNAEIGGALGLGVVKARLHRARSRLRRRLANAGVWKA